jgi:hypothetical protein
VTPTAPLDAPASYPGHVPDRGVVVRDGRVAAWSGLPHELATAAGRDGAAGLDARQPMVAVGSNAAPSQLVRKFTAAGTRAWVPILPAVVDGVAAGHAAFVASAGYVPAAPYAVDGAGTMHLVWLDDEQIEALDATEPNYRRVPLPAAGVARPVTEGEVVGEVVGAEVYVCDHDLLADGQDRVLPLQPQAAVFATLRRTPSLAALLDGLDDPPRRLARDPELRARVNVRLASVRRHRHGLECS